MENPCVQQTTNKQPPHYRAIQIYFVGLGGQVKSGVWQYIQQEATEEEDIFTKDELLDQSINE